MISRIPTGYAALIALVIWGAALLSLNLIRFGTLGLDEGAAKDLILLWSIVDQIASPVGTYGAPDLRALLFIPPALYWSGSVVAVKVFTMMLTFGALYLLAKWNYSENNESSLVAAALLLICPVLITQIDSLGTGPFLLLTLALAYWCDIKYRESDRDVGSWFFSQMLLVGLAVSIHPAGLAYPLALAWTWAKKGSPPIRKRSILIGVLITTTLILAFRMGWQDGLTWLINPLQSLADAVTNGYSRTSNPANLATGFVVAALLCIIAYRDRTILTNNLTGLTLLLSIVIGLVAADAAWALLVITLMLFRGAHQLINANQSFKKESLIGQRGLVITVAFIIATLFMLIDKSYARIVAGGVYSAQDTLIQTLCADVSDSDAKTPFKAASQWPARTMLDCKRDVFPLPLPAENGQALLTKIKGITHLIFDHSLESNEGLNRNIADIAGQAKTLSLQQGGVIVAIPLSVNSTSEELDQDEATTSAPPATDQTLKTTPTPEPELEKKAAP